MKRKLACLLTAMCALVVLADDNKVDSTKIYFQIGRRQFIPGLGDNRASMDRFVTSVRKAQSADDIDHILVRAYASPDGTNEANERLTRHRCDEITRYIINATGISPELVHAVPEGIAWEELRTLVAETPDVPSRQAILDIIDNTPVLVYDSMGRPVTGRNEQLQLLDGGAPYRWMFNNLFPRLRNAVAMSLYLKSEIRAAKAAAVSAAEAAAGAAVAAANAARAAAAASRAASDATSDIAAAIRAAEQAAARAAQAADDARKAAQRAEAAAAEAQAAAQAAATADEVSAARAKAAEAEAARDVALQAAADAAVSQAAAENALAEAEALIAKAREDGTLPADTTAVATGTPVPAGDPLHRFALKTNLLYYIALMPNLELEWRINQSWSLLLDADVAWYSKDSAHKYYQLALIDTEARYWLPRGTVWHGMYVGAFAGGSWYDLENGRKGYQGNAGLGGLSFGYMWPVTRTLSLEAGLGVGYMYTRYKEYVPFDGHYLYQRTKALNYVGPLKLKFSLVWRFDDINKRKAL